VVGGPSGSGLAHPTHLAELASELGIADLVRFEPPVAQSALVDWYRAADLAVVPSYNESFGLVALEAQACGTPVVAADVGGLRAAVADRRSGLLVASHDPWDWAYAMGDLVESPRLRAELSAGALRHAAGFGWPSTAAAMMDVYEGAVLDHRRRLLDPSRVGSL